VNTFKGGEELFSVNFLEDRVERREWLEFRRHDEPPLERITNQFRQPRTFDLFQKVNFSLEPISYRV